MPGMREKLTGTILVVDDNAANRNLLQAQLLLEGHAVLIAVDGRSALATFAARQPDLVLLDVQMPDISGFEVCRDLKSDPTTRLTPVVLITGLSAVEDRVRGIAAGADDFLTKPIQRQELFARVQSLLSLKFFTDQLEQAETVLFTLARSIEAKDPYTEGHCQRLSEYSARLGRVLGMSPQQIVALRRAGIVHDVGKVAIPDSILLKPARLTVAEMNIVREHSAVGERICAPMKSFALVLPIIRHHHEKLDGTGYPDGLRGAQIPFSARVLQVIDVYDALTTARPYKIALSSGEALAVMEEEVSRGWWDSGVFAGFRDMLGKTAAPWPGPEEESPQPSSFPNNPPPVPRNPPSSGWLLAPFALPFPPAA